MRIGKFQFDQKGQMTIIAMTAVVGSVLFTSWMYSQILSMEQNLRHPRVKARQTIQRAKILSALTVPVLYDCTSTVASVQTCTINAAQIQSILETVPGANCTDYVAVAGEIAPAGGTCGFVLRPVNAATPMLNYDSREFKAVVHYMGNEVRLAPIPINITIPGEILTADIALCPAAKPLLKGFDPSGNAICEGFTEPTNCGAEEFVETIDPLTMQVTCHKYVSGVSCDPTFFFIDNLVYTAGKYSGSCGSRQNPFQYYDFNAENFMILEAPRPPKPPPGFSTDYNWTTAPVPQIPPPPFACDAAGGSCVKN